YGSDDHVGRQPVQIPADAIPVHAAGNKPDAAAFGAFPQINQHVTKHTAAHGRMTGKGRSNGCWKDCDFLRCLNAAGFPVEMPTTREIMVEGKFGQHVRRHVRRSGNGSGISLRSKLSTENERECDFATGKLLGILDGCSPDPMIVEVVSRAEFAGSRVVVTDSNASVLAVPQREISRIRRNPNPVRRLQAPRLSAKKFPLASLQIQPIEANAVGMAVGSNKDVSRIVSVEVEFNVTGHVILAELGRSLEIEPRILSGRAVLRQVALHRVAVRNRAEVGRRHVAGVGGAEDVFKIHESARSEFRGADAERERRRFWLLLRRWSIRNRSSRRCRTGAAGGAQRRINDTRRNFRRLARHLLFGRQLLFQFLDLLLLLRKLFLLVGYRLPQFFQLVRDIVRGRTGVRGVLAKHKTRGQDYETQTLQEFHRPSLLSLLVQKKIFKFG